VIPLIGISAYVETARFGVWEVPATLVPQAYVTKLHAAGARAVVVPPAAAGAQRVVDALDGLLLAGGADIDPATYGQAFDPRTSGVRPDRDAGEQALLAAALARDLPVLGICRGMQLLAVAHGGRLHQHLPAVVGDDRHRPAPGRFGRHLVRLAAGSRTAAICGTELSVPTYHHQGVSDPGTLHAVGWADDGTVEAVETPAATFCIGVLWHPEVDDDDRLFTALVGAAGG